MKKTKFGLWALLIAVSVVLDLNRAESQPTVSSLINVSKNFANGGGVVKVISSDPAIVRFEPQNEGDGQWGQVWFYFKVDGLTPGQQIILQLDNEPHKVGISPQINFSYDQKTWGLTNTGKFSRIDGRDFFIYKHTVKNNKVWFSYGLPYTPGYEEKLLLSDAEKYHGVEVFELCKTRKNRPVMALRIDDKSNNTDKKYGIWLRARVHAFESGSSWVLDGLTRWLLSNDSSAKALRSCALITVVPIVDVDGVEEGRTGKNQYPFDPDMGWDEEPSFWVQARTAKAALTTMADKKMLDMYLDFHGPGNNAHPYFLIISSDDLPYKTQQQNRKKFFEILKSQPLNKEARQTQSMTQIFYSERPISQLKGNSQWWVTMKTNDYNVSLSLEVNMGTPLSTKYGYQAEGIKIGKAISDYFVNGNHQK